ncbi:MAG: hypothetical protein SFX73_21700 [Kofleriaceae bacterium]|nr:hypothetical protein [Kofleriaceae bacterium]
MTAPYRSSGGTPCPRCELPLARERDDELSCANGCGTWLGNAHLPIAPDDLRPISRGNPSRATALPFTRCLVCKLSLNDLYKGDRKVLVLGQCLEHGIWIEQADRAAFEAAYAADIPALAQEREQREAEELAAKLAREKREKHERELSAMPDFVKELVRRVALLEHQVEDLKRKVEKLS